MSRRSWGRWLRLAPFVAAVVLSLVVLFTPGPDVPSAPGGTDKIIHGTLFAVLALTGRVAGIRLLPLALALVVYAGGSEVLQAVLPIQRDGDWHDAATDVAGAAVGLLLAVPLLRRVGP